jgi:hypothetical protein
MYIMWVSSTVALASQVNRMIEDDQQVGGNPHVCL